MATPIYNISRHMVLSRAMRETILARPAYFIDFYIENLNWDMVEPAAYIKDNKNKIGPDEVWAGFTLIVIGIQVESQCAVSDGLAVISRSGVLGLPEHHNYETAWIMIRELGDRSKAFRDQSEANEDIQYWGALEGAIARAFASADADV